MSNGLSSDSNNWGDFGSYIGGTLSVIISTLNLILLLLLTLQTREQQNHEWITEIRITSYQKLLEQLEETDNPRKLFQGRDLDDDTFCLIKI